MSDEVKAKIAAELALLTQLVPFPVSPFFYGSDISCDTDLSPDLAEVDGGSTLALGQALVRRLDCLRGENPDDPNYGIGLRQMVNTGIVASDIGELGGQIRVELLKDDRVDSLTVRVSDQSNGTGTDLLVQISVQPIDMNLGPFSLTLSVSDVGILLNEIRSER